MEQINNNNRCCATCAFWLGNRKPNRLGWVEVNSKMEQGQCSKRNLSENYTQQASYKCCNYSAWNTI